MLFLKSVATSVFDEFKTENGGNLLDDHNQRTTTKLFQYKKTPL